MIANRYFKYYPFLVALVVFFQVMCFIYARRQIDIFGFPINISGIIFPLDIYLIEIIGECYTYQFARQVVWVNFIIHILFMLVIIINNSIPYSTFMHNDLIYSYEHLIRISWICALGSLIFNFIADMFSAQFVPKTKVTFEGRYPFARIFIAQFCSEIIVTSSYLISFLTNGYSLYSPTKVIIATVVAKSIIAVLVYPFAKIIINWIKTKEGFDAYDFNMKYKIFNFDIHLENIKFLPFQDKDNDKDIR